MIQNFDEIIGVNDQSVGVLKKNRLHPSLDPDQSSMQSHLVALWSPRHKVHILAMRCPSRLRHDFLNFIDVISNHINVFDDVTYRSDAEFLALVQAAKGAIVPGAISGNSEHQTFSFTWRSNRPKFKPFVFLTGFHILASFSPFSSI
jgi:hypothetical protein